MLLWALPLPADVVFWFVLVATVVSPLDNLELSVVVGVPDKTLVAVACVCEGISAVVKV
jgi:hypothetical protein